MPTPMFTEKSQLYSDLSVNTMGGVDWNTAYSITNQYALIGGVGMSSESNYRPVFGQETYESSDNHYKSVGIGYFNSNNKGKLNNFEVFLTYKFADYSTYKSRRDYYYYNSNYTESTYGESHRWSLQGNWGTINPFAFINTVYSIRLGAIKFDKPFIKKNNQVLNEYEINYKKLYKTIDQSWSMLLGRSALKCKYQIQLGYCLNGTAIDSPINALSLNIHFGLVFTPKYKNRRLVFQYLNKHSH
jgi:hypothetical protein